MNRPILQVNGLTMNFGGIQALSNIDLEVRSKEIVALIGPNGAGKTTLFNCLTGIYRPGQGSIVLSCPQSGQKCRIDGLKPHQITKKGMARTFQNIRLFPRMTALENVMIGRHCRTRSTIFGAIFRPRSTREEEREIVAMSYAILEKVGLTRQAHEFAGNIAYGDQRRLEIGRALATEPFLLLLDEPAAGMNPQETAELVELVQEIRAEGLAILLIEHDMKLVMSLSDRIVVMDYGQVIASGGAAEIAANPVVIEAYLGEKAEE